MYSPSLRTVLAVSFAGLCGCATLVTAVIVGHDAARTLHQRIATDLSGVARQMADSLDRQLSERLHELDAAAKEVLPSLAGRDEQRRVLAGLRERTPSYARVTLMGPDGAVRLTSPHAGPASDRAELAFVHAAQGLPFIGEVHEAPPGERTGSGRPIKVLDLAVPVRDANGQSAGVLAARLRWRWARELQARYAGPMQARQPGAELMVLARDGTVLLGPPDLLGKALPAALAGSATLDRADRGVRAVTWPGYGRSLLARAPTRGIGAQGDPGWRVLVRQDAASALQPLVHLQREIICTGFFVAVVAALLGWLLAGWLAYPFRRLSQVDGQPWRHGASRTGFIVRELRDGVHRLYAAAEAMQRQEQSLQAREAEMRAIYHGAPIAMALLDRTMRYMAVSEALSLAHGLPPGGQIGRTPREVLPAHLASSLEAVYRQVLTTGTPVRNWECEYDNPQAGRGARSWLMNVMPLCADGGEIVGISMAALDITERRQAEDDVRRMAATLEQRVKDRTAALEAEMQERKRAEAALMQAQRLEAIGQLSAGVSHDFNNLLTVVMTNVELAAQRTSDPDLVRMLRSALGAAERGARLTGQLLAFSRRQHLHVEALDLNEVVRNMDDLLRRTLGATLRIEQQLDPEAPAVLADRTHLELCLLNLAINARDASDGQGSAVIATRIVPPADPLLPEELRQAAAAGSGFVLVSMRDHGRGMPPDVLARCQEPFFTTKPVGRGTGLGLSTVLGVVQQFGGAMRVDSTPGNGATVRLFLPRAAAPSMLCASPIPAGHAGIAEAGLEGLRVLLVDDDADVREVTVAQLQGIGCDPVSEPDGLKALEALIAHPESFDVLVTDFAMPGMNGGDLARAARHIRPNLPILMVTGYADPQGQPPAAGDLWLQLAKPYCQSQLGESLRTVVGRRLRSRR